MKRDGAEHVRRWWMTFPSRLVVTVLFVMWGADPRLPPTRRRGILGPQWKGLGGLEHCCGGTGSLPRGFHLVSPFQTLVWWALFSSSKAFQKKMAFTCLIIMFNGCFCFLFQSFWLCACAWWRRPECVSDTVDVLEWVCVRVFKGLWELVRFRSGWEAILINGRRFVSLCWQTRESCPPQWVLAKLALFILNIYNMCACTVLCN